MNEWWKGFLDAGLPASLGPWRCGALMAEQAGGLWAILGLRYESGVLGARCGYGRFSRSLAERGAIVLASVNRCRFSSEPRSGSLPESRLRYLQRDLRHPIAESGFDCALNLFTSIGYGTEDDDRKILATLRAALRPGGLLFVETKHRYLLAAHVSRDALPPSVCRTARSSSRIRTSTRSTGGSSRARTVRTTGAAPRCLSAPRGRTWGAVWASWLNGRCEAAVHERGRTLGATTRRPLGTGSASRTPAATGG
jgi:SAM-dependent methyltransferase